MLNVRYNVGVAAFSSVMYAISEIYRISLGTASIICYLIFQRLSNEFEQCIPILRADMVKQHIAEVGAVEMCIRDRHIQWDSCNGSPCRDPHHLCCH